MRLTTHRSPTRSDSLFPGNPGACQCMPFEQSDFDCTVSAFLSVPYAHAHLSRFPPRSSADLVAVRSTAFAKGGGGKS